MNGQKKFLCNHNEELNQLKIRFYSIEFLIFLFDVFTTSLTITVSDFQFRKKDRRWWPWNRSSTFDWKMKRYRYGNYQITNSIPSWERRNSKKKQEKTMFSVEFKWQPRPKTGIATCPLFSVDVRCAWRVHFQSNKKPRGKHRTRQIVTFHYQKKTNRTRIIQNEFLLYSIHSSNGKSTISIVAGSCFRAGYLRAECSRPFSFGKKVFWTHWRHQERNWTNLVDSNGARFEHIYCREYPDERHVEPGW